MQRELKSKISIDKIISAATERFAEEGYAATSVDSVCETCGVSKGLIYHYFDNKEKLYIACAEKCFEGLAGYLNEHADAVHGLPGGLEEYMQLREKYFAGNPVACKMFLRTVLDVPKNMQDEIMTVREPLDKQNEKLVHAMLGRSKLNRGVTLEDASVLLLGFERAFHIEVAKEIRNCSDAAEIFRIHETMLTKWISILLYGLIEK